MSNALIERILVTGGGGFIGSHVVRQLVQQGREVAVLLRAGRKRPRIDDLLPAITQISGDLVHLDSCKGAILDFRPQAVLHLGWDGVQGAERNNAVQLANVGAALALYRLAQDAACESFVGLGSQAEYGPAAGRIREDSPTRPTTVYGAAKLALATVLERYAAQGGPRFAWLRVFSCYGPDDDPAWLIPYMIRSLLAGAAPALTRCEQVWDYLHVDDAAAAVIAAMDHRLAGVFNLGSGQPRPLSEIVTMVRDAIDPALPLGFGQRPYRDDQVMHLEADVTALTSATGWQPRVPLEQGIATTVAWYRAEASHA